VGDGGATELGVGAGRASPLLAPTLIEVGPSQVFDALRRAAVAPLSDGGVDPTYERLRHRALRASFSTATTSCAAVCDLLAAARDITVAGQSGSAKQAVRVIPNSK
jgi:hypothetical protein